LPFALLLLAVAAPKMGIPLKKEAVDALKSRGWWVTKTVDQSFQKKMHNPNRDILVLFKQELMTPQAMEHEVSLLHELLYRVERLDNIVAAHELLDINKYKIISKAASIKNYLKNKAEKPFVFLNNKN
jgi:ribosome biogenesis protein Nip4